jgi:hypothetical protein
MEEEEKKQDGGLKGGNKKRNRNRKAKAPQAIKEVEGGFYDEMGFYILPNDQGKSTLAIYIFLGFYDPDGYLFNKDGLDEFGGYFDNEGFYHPGEKNKHDFTDNKPSQKSSQGDRKGAAKGDN